MTSTFAAETRRLSDKRTVRHKSTTRCSFRASLQSIAAYGMYRKHVHTHTCMVQTFLRPCKTRRVAIQPGPKFPVYPPNDLLLSSTRFVPTNVCPTDRVVGLVRVPQSRSNWPWVSSKSGATAGIAVMCVCVCVCVLWGLMSSDVGMTYWGQRVCVWIILFSLPTVRKSALSYLWWLPQQRLFTCFLLFLLLL